MLPFPVVKLALAYFIPLLLSCSDVDCVTRDYSTLLIHSTDCDGLDAYTTRVIKEMPIHPPIDVRVVIVRQSYLNQWGDGYAGLAFCDSITVAVLTDDWPRSAYAHELRHLEDNCMTPNHEGWDTDGTFAALERLAL